MTWVRSKPFLLVTCYPVAFLFVFVYCIHLFLIIWIIFLFVFVYCINLFLIFWILSGWLFRGLVGILPYTFASFFAVVGSDCWSLCMLVLGWCVFRRGPVRLLLWGALELHSLRFPWTTRISLAMMGSSSWLCFVSFDHLCWLVWTRMGRKLRGLWYHC